ncbi:MAG: glutaredoxin [Parcubacteria group bacterium]|nr:glutaredoxin [Parcubacteria group bacterium]
MLTLYVKDGCPYCAKVHAAAKELGITFNEKNVIDIDVSEELEARGGKRQTPYLVDEDKKVEMYEADDIIEYLHQNFGTKE